MAYDPATRQVVARGYAPMAYDPATRQLVLFGGGGDAGAKFATTCIWERDHLEEAPHDTDNKPDRPRLRLDGV